MQDAVVAARRALAAARAHAEARVSVHAGIAVAEVLAALDARLREELDFVVTEMYREGIAYSEALQQFRRSFLLEVLSAHCGNQCKAAAALGMHRNTMHRMIHALSINTAEMRLDAKRPSATRVYGTTA